MGAVKILSLRLRSKLIYSGALSVAWQRYVLICVNYDLEICMASIKYFKEPFMAPQKEFLERQSASVIDKIKNQRSNTRMPLEVFAIGLPYLLALVGSGFVIFLQNPERRKTRAFSSHNT